MKFFNKLLTTILISTQAFAGLAPSTMQGQADASAKVKSSIQVPFNQATDLGGLKTLVETGNGNIIPDPGFESLTSLWTASGGATAAANTTAVGTGVNGYDWDSNAAAQTLQSTSKTIPNAYRGQNGIAACLIKVPSGTATHTLVVNDGSTDIGTPITITNSTNFIATKYNFQFPSSGTLRIKIASVASNEPEIYVDDCYIRLADNIFDAAISTPWTSYTLVVGATTTPPTAGTVVTNQAKWRRIGDSMEISYTFQQSSAGTAGTGAYLYPLPTGYTIDTTKLTLPTTLAAATTLNSGATSVGNGTIANQTVAGTNFSSVLSVSPYNSTNLTLAWTSTSAGQQYPIGSSTGAVGTLNNTVVYMSFTAKVPIVGWSTSSAVSADQTDYDWTSYTPTFTGFGTVTSPECFHSRVASNLMLRCKFVIGTTTATEARLSLPTGLTSADATKIPSISLASGWSANSTTANASVVPLIETSITYLTFGRVDGSNSPTTKRNGNDMGLNGSTMTLFAAIPIQGWQSNGRAPTTIGSSTSNAPNAERIERATIANNGTCTIVSQSGTWITSVSHPATGKCTLNFSSGWSATPSCVCIANDPADTNRLCAVDNAISTSSGTFVTNIINTSATGNDHGFSVICMGSR